MNLLRHETVRNLVAIYVPSLIMSFGQGLVIPTIPRLAAVFDVTPGMAAQVVTAVSLGRLFSTLPTGMFVDRFGTRPSMVLGALALTVLSVLTAVAPAFWVVLAAQFGSGAAVGLWQAGREISAVNLVRPDQRGRLMAGFFGLTSLGIAIGPVVGGLATEASGYQAAFLLYAGVGAGVLCISAFVKNVRPPARPAGEPFLNFGSVNEVEPRYRSTFAVVIFGTFVDSLYRTMTNSLLPLYVVTQRGFSSADLGALFGIIGLMNVAFIV
ncbi:MAG: MFS transporter, partial [Chloroflexota bacterium]